MITLDRVGFVPESGELIGPSATTRLAPQPSSLLDLLASRSGSVVSRDEIREHLWPEGKVEFEQGIAFAVREIRKGIEEAGGDPSILETIPKRGFRLGLVADHASDHASDPRPVRHSPRRLRGPLVGLVLALAAFAAVRFAVPRTPVVALFAYGSAPDGPGAAVSRSLSNALTTSLTEAFESRAGIVGPTGTGDLDGPDDTEGARERLGACLVMSGDVTSLGNDSVVVFTQIVRSSDRVHVWARLDTVSTASAVARVLPAVTAGVSDALTGC